MVPKHINAAHQTSSARFDSSHGLVSRINILLTPIDGAKSVDMAIFVGPASDTAGSPLTQQITQGSGPATPAWNVLVVCLYGRSFDRL